MAQQEQKKPNIPPVRGVGAAARALPGGRHSHAGYARPEERLCAIRGGEYTNTGECRIPAPR